MSADVVVVGGGIAGLAAAIGCRTAGLSVAVLASSDWARPLLGETLPPEIRPVFSRLGLWQAFAASFQSLPGRVAVWGSDRPTFTDHAFNAFGPAWIAEPQRLRPLMEGVAADQGVRVFDRAAIQRSDTQSDGRRRLTVATERDVVALTTTFVIGATGRRWSPLRAATDRHVVEDAMIGLVCVIAAPNDSRYGLPLVEAAENGWWYSVRLRNGCYVVAYLTDTDLAKEGIERTGSRQAFLNACLPATSETAMRVAGVTLGEPAVVAANTYWSTAVTGDHSLSVGDAAWTVDPLSGLGIYSGCNAALSAAGTISDHMAGTKSALHDYALAQRREYEAMLADRSTFYALERRWPDSPFWHRRHRGHARAMAARSSA